MDINNINPPPSINSYPPKKPHNRNHKPKKDARAVLVERKPGSGRSELYFGDALKSFKLAYLVAATVVNSGCGAFQITSQSKTCGRIMKFHSLILKLLADFWESIVSDLHML